MNKINRKIEALKQALQSMPEYADIIPFFLKLYKTLSEDVETGISFTIQAQQQYISEGFPLISPTDMHVDENAARAFLRKIVATFIESGRDAHDALASIDTALVNEDFETAPIYRAILERQRKPIDDLASSLNVMPPLLEYLFEIPLKHQLEQYAEKVNPDDFLEWHNGYCPVCGSRAGMAEFVGEEGKRKLSCSACSFSWNFKRLGCPFCGNDDPEELSYFTAGSGSTRVDTCKACSRYIKTRDSRKGENLIPLEIEDILTMHLDIMASKEGFERGK